MIEIGTGRTRTTRRRGPHLKVLVVIGGSEDSFERIRTKRSQVCADGNLNVCFCHKYLWLLATKLRYIIAKRHGMDPKKRVSWRRANCRIASLIFSIFLEEKKMDRHSYETGLPALPA